MTDKEKVLLILKERYGTEFSYKGYQENAKKYADIYVQAENFPDYTVVAHIEKNMMGELDVTDNYMSYFYLADYEKKIAEIASEVYKTNVIVKGSVFRKAMENVYDKDTPKETIFSDPSHVYLGYIALDNHDSLWERRKEDVVVFVQKLKDEGLYLNGALYYLSASDFSKFTKESFTDGSAWKWENGVGTVKMDTGKSSLEVKWYPNH